MNLLQKALHTHFMPEGKPAPPRPRRPEALISEMIYQDSMSQTPQVSWRTYPVMAFQDYLLRLVPIAIFHRTLQICPMVAVKILKYPILILQPSKFGPLWWRTILDCG